MLQFCFCANMHKYSCTCIKYEIWIWQSFTGGIMCADIRTFTRGLCCWVSFWRGVEHWLCQLHFYTDNPFLWLSLHMYMIIVCEETRGYLCRHLIFMLAPVQTSEGRVPMFVPFYLNTFQFSVLHVLSWCLMIVGMSFRPYKWSISLTIFVRQEFWKVSIIHIGMNHLHQRCIL